MVGVGPGRDQMIWTGAAEHVRRGSGLTTATTGRALHA